MAESDKNKEPRRRLSEMADDATWKVVDTGVKIVSDIEEAANDAFDWMRDRVDDFKRGASGGRQDGPK
jgi:hypothetical protein